MNIGRLIGNTPMIKINYEYEGKQSSIYTKLEYYNYSGSIKDRIALYIIETERKNGNLKKDQAIVEVTSGNTGISFSAIGALSPKKRADLKKPLNLQKILQKSTMHTDHSNLIMN